MSVTIQPLIEDRIRALVREEIAAYFRRARTVTAGDGTLPYREYLANRDEPPASPAAIPDLLP